MPREKSLGKPTTRRYTDAEKDQAVRLVRKLREELGTDHGTVKRVASGLGDVVESVRTWVRERDVVDGVAGPDTLRVRELESAHAHPVPCARSHHSERYLPSTVVTSGLLSGEFGL